MVKSLSFIFASFVMVGLWLVTQLIVDVRLNNLISNGDLPYGPLPSVEANYYSYNGLVEAFDSSVPLDRVKEFSRSEFEELLITSLGPKMQKGLKPILSSVLTLSEDYQVDPLWIISIIMVESNFQFDAISPKNARGLMQIKPDTALHLYQLMQKNVPEDQVNKNLNVPQENIEVGIFYLKKLLQNFRMNYGFATVAYNIGPQKLRNRLSEKSLDVKNFSYLVKVQERYTLFSQNLKKVLKDRPSPFEFTYVFSDQGLKYDQQIANFFPLSSSENLFVFLP
ncbi:MAG: lytic transglycosylase domain-containing protein [Bacteriovoracaceae bacterium]|nr:lytic transglycosylase domain-containing protein [Bacteriovoracaceae bacterium]